MAGDTAMPKPDLSTPKGAVEHGSRILSSVEPALFKLAADIGNLLPVVDALQPVTGAMLAGNWRGRVIAIQGLIGQAAADLHALHIEGVKVAQDHDIDVPQPRGGGPR